MHGGNAAPPFVNRQAAAFTPPADLVAGFFQFGLRNLLQTLAGGQQGGFIDQVGQLGTGKAGRAAGNPLKADSGRHLHFSGMHLQDLFAPPDVRQVHHHLPVEAAGTQQGRVQDVRTVGGGNHDYIGVVFKTVHLHQQGVQRLFPLVIAAAHAVTALAAHGVNFINENQAGRRPFGLFKHIADTACTHPHEHFHKVRAADGIEGSVGLPGNGTRQQSFARAGRPDHQHAAGNGSAQVAEFFRIAQELHQFPHFLLGFADAGHILERHLVLVRGDEARPAFAEAHGPPGPAALRAEHEKQNHQNEHDGQQIQQDAAPGTGFTLELRIRPQQLLDAVSLELQGKRHFHAFKTLLVHGGVSRSRGPDAGDNLSDQHVLVAVFRQDDAVLSSGDAAFQGQAVEFRHGKLLGSLRNEGNILSLFRPVRALHHPVAGKFIQQRLVAVRKGHGISQRKGGHFHLRLNFLPVHQRVNNAFGTVLAQHHFHGGLGIVQHHAPRLILGFKGFQIFLAGAQPERFRGEKAKRKDAYNEKYHDPHAPVGGFGPAGAGKFGRTGRTGWHSVRHNVVSTQKLMNRAA